MFREIAPTTRLIINFEIIILAIWKKEKY